MTAKKENLDNWLEYKQRQYREGKFRLKYKQAPAEYQFMEQKIISEFREEPLNAEPAIQLYYEDYHSMVNNNLKEMYGLSFIESLRHIMDWAFLKGYSPFQFVVAVARCCRLREVKD